MKTKFILPVIVLMIAASCSSGMLGEKVKEPFRGNKYESNNRFFRGTGKGESSQDNIARGKADIEAKAELASQVQTTVKEVSDQYLGQSSNEAAANVADKFQSLIREVMDTDIADVRKIGEEKYFNKKENKYTVFIAYEIKKNAMFRFMRKKAELNTSLSDKQREEMLKVIDEEIKASEKEN